MPKKLFKSLLLLVPFFIFACGKGDVVESHVEVQKEIVKTDKLDTRKVDKNMGDTVTTDSGLKYEELTVGDGEVASSGHKVKVHYTGWLTNGKKFDSSKDRNQPFSFTLGGGQVIKGWDEGVAGMKVGGKRKLTIPSELGYGSRGAGGVIPPGATLVFEVELLGVS